MSPKDVVWKLAPHTRGKHEVLRHYLTRWFPILDTFAGRVAFIDGFAGPGEYKDGEPGSPLIALEVFRKYTSRFKGEAFFYAIFFASKHWKGADVMEDAISKVVPFGDFAFRGSPFGQRILFDPKDYTSLQSLLQERFKGKGWVTIEQVLEFVGSDRTDFHTGQVKRPVLAPMEKAKLIEVDPKTRKKHGYPAGTRLRFV